MGRRRGGAGRQGKGRAADGKAAGRRREGNGKATGRRREGWGRRGKPREGDGRAWGGGYGLGTPTGRQRELSSTRGRCCHGPPPRDAAQHMGKKRSRGGPRRAPRWRQTKWCTAGKQSAARHEERDGVPFPETAAGQRADAMREAGVSRCGDRSSGGERRAGGRQSAVGEERRLPTAFPAFPSPSPSIPGLRDGEASSGRAPASLTGPELTARATAAVVCQGPS